MKVRKKSTRFIALGLVVLQVLLAIGCVSAYADDGVVARSYDIYRTDASKMTLDAKVGADEPWDKVPWSEQLQEYTRNNGADLTGFTFSENPGHFKALWASDALGSYLYFLIELDDPDGEYSGKGDWASDVFQVFVDETGTATGPIEANGTVARRTASQHNKPSDKIQKVSNWFEYFVARDGNTVTIEGKYIFTDTQYAKADGVLGIDVFSQRSNGSTFVNQLTWSTYGSASNATKLGRGVLKNGYAVDLGNEVDETADVVYYSNGVAVASTAKGADGKVTLPAEASGSRIAAWKNRGDNKLYAPGSAFEVGGAQVKFDAVFLNLTLQSGASVRLSGDAALKFEGLVSEFATLKDYLSKTGIVIVETRLLNDEMIAKGVTPAALTAAGIEFTKAEADSAATFEGTLDGITDTELLYSAIPYAVVKMGDGSTVEFGGEYAPENNARSVAAVSTAAYQDRAMIKASEYKFRANKDFGVPNFEALSYSPYTMEQLALLKGFAKI